MVVMVVMVVGILSALMMPFNKFTLDRPCSSISTNNEVHQSDNACSLCSNM